MNLLPILNNNDPSDGDRYKHGERGGYLEWNEESQQRNSNQRFAKTERRTNQSSDE